MSRRASRKRTTTRHRSRHRSRSGAILLDLRTGAWLTTRMWRQLAAEARYRRRRITIR
jgi:hypothetical protein